MAKRPTPPLNLRRRASRIEPKLKLIIFCEGANTEPKYIMDFAFEWGNRLVEVCPIVAQGVPLTLIQRACREKVRLDEKAAKEADSFSGAFEVWGVFDVDDHPNIPNARALANANGVKHCLSNPCFDLWGILHYEQHDAELHRHAVQKKLKKLMPGYDPKGSKTFDYSALHGLYNVARAHAVELLRRRTEEDNPDGNPSTDVFRLLDTIIFHGMPPSKSNAV